MRGARSRRKDEATPQASRVGAGRLAAARGGNNRSGFGACDSRLDCPGVLTGADAPVPFCTSARWRRTIHVDVGTSRLMRVFNMIEIGSSS